MKPEVSHPTKVCPSPELWRCHDSEATEVEVLDFLQYLVRMLKPKVIIETGCYDGYGTEQLVLGILANGFGHVHFCDIGQDKLASARERPGVPALSLYNCTGVELIARVEGPIDFAFLDSGPDGIRIGELKALLPKLAPEGVVAVHDVGQHGLRAHFDFAMESLPEYQHIIFSTPRGLALVRKKQQ